MPRFTDAADAAAGVTLQRLGPSSSLRRRRVDRRGMRCIAWLVATLLSGTALADPGANASPPAMDPLRADVWSPAQWRTVGAVATVHGAFALWTWAIWYRNQTQSDHFIFRDEGFFGADTYAGGADKLGHCLGNYALTRGTAQLFGSVGMKPLPRLLLANGLTALSYLVIEVKDGWHARFGFSWQDVAANLTGNLLATAFELSPTLDAMVDLRLTHWPSAAYIERISDGDANVGEDYSGMRFDLMLKGSAFVPPPRETPPALHILRYLLVGVGFATRGYKPVHEPRPTQTLSLVIAFDLQTLLDDEIYDRVPGRGRQLLRFATELATVPYSSWALPLATRAGPPP